MSNIEKEQAICESCETRPCYYACDKILSERLRDAVDELIELKQQIAILLHPQLRNSRFDFNARYLHFDEAQQIPEFQDITKALENAKNFEPWPVGNFTFYRRGTGGLWLYVVPTCDFRVPRERKSHKVEVAK